jgi:NDP-sugar pyrophosphorylase family protein
VLLAAGKGERLGSITRALPKPMLEVLGKPIILHNIEMCQRAGVSRFYVNLHHCPEKITGFLGDGRKWGVQIDYAYEETLLGTSGALTGFRRFLKEQPFYVVYADNFSDYDLANMWQRHSAARAEMSIAVFELEETRNSGVVVMDGGGWVRRFVEKPRVPIGSRWVSSGIYVLEPVILDAIPEGASDFGRDIIPRLVADGRRIMGYKVDHKVLAIDTPELLSQVVANAGKETKI